MKRLIVCIFLIIGLMSNFSLKAQYAGIKDGIYVNPESAYTPDELMLKVKNDSLFVYLNMFGIFVVDGPGPIVRSKANMVAECKLVPMGCGVYELSDTLPEYKLFKDIKIEQSGKVESDSVCVDVVFSQFDRHWINFDVGLMPWLGNKTVPNTGTVTFKVSPRIEYFYVALLPEKFRPVTNMYYNQLGPMKYMYNKPIFIEGSHITITIPNNVNGIF